MRGPVERYRVCWETCPEFSQIDHERCQTGVAVELNGTHDRPEIVPTAGCKHCIPVLQALLSIADFAVSGAHEALGSIRAHSGIEYATERGGRPDVVVSLTLSTPDHQAGPELEVVVREVRGRLSSLGASERSWRRGSSGFPVGPKCQFRVVRNGRHQP